MLSERWLAFCRWRAETDDAEATAEVEPSTGTVVGVFTTGTTVQMYQLAHSVPADTWNGSEPGGQS